MPKRYRVVGNSVVHGHQPGQTFHADLEPAHEARMLKGGFLVIEPAGPARPQSRKPEAPASETQPEEEE